ncbi:hypothetical protein [Bordetella bronchiseptica]|uniref:hypothetical protein n=1 Tax=Bordetella bronchiseptica TaxID=518 RepID=UPI00028FBD64|nr:hypothetical protein [Bordetella bronchiseptica]AUL15858.1 hypothetical protein BTL45_13580 [Bordetella bronchiseptica]AWP58961.1 hypothetical protein B7P02_13515 [Bordetella bronchiseptica]KAK78197.1 hypothetical protein L507_2414 [Bordetella bronchiseptica CA90 BB02]KCV56906.1 hypothetical protein L492_2466 [Bordetella bronchiseptica 7E71]KDC30780.1 hypothetical protein L505_2516 [Bordetella bronchiseptica F4563]
MMRHERLRFWLAGLAAAATGWLCYAGLARLAGALGVATWIPYPAPRRQWLLIGENWQSAEFSGAIADASVFLTALAAVAAYYCARIVYHLSFAPVRQRRARWLIAGWIVGTVAMVALSQGLGWLYAAYPGFARIGWLSAALGFAVLAGAASGFARAWGRLMRARKVPATE